MAVLGRRNWANLLAEFKLRAGLNDTSFDARSKEFLAAAFWDIALTWHHHQLDATDTSKVMSTSNNEVDIASLSLFGIHSIWRRAVSGGIGAFIDTLEYAERHSLLQGYVVTAGTPKKYTRIGDKLYLDRLPVTAWELTIFYYKDPTAPDFDAPTESELDQLWDEHILELALSRGLRALGRADLAAEQEAAFARFVESVPQSLLADVKLHGIPQKPRQGTSQGGAIG